MNRLLVILVLLLTAVPALAQQNTKTSRWRSSTGSTITLTTHEQWVSVDVASPQAQPRRWQGRWLRKYDLFDYTAQGVTYTAQLVNNNRITVSGSDGRNYTWTALQGGAGSPAQPSGNSSIANAVTGRWASSTGNIFDVKSVGRNVMLKAFLNDGKVLQTTGSWISHSAFRYQFPGFKETATCTYLQDGRLQVVSQRGTTYWNKVR